MSTTEALDSSIIISTWNPSTISYRVCAHPAVDLRYNEHANTLLRKSSIPEIPNKLLRFSLNLNSMKDSPQTIGKHELHRPSPASYINDLRRIMLDKSPSKAHRLFQSDDIEEQHSIQSPFADSCCNNIPGLTNPRMSEYSLAKACVFVTQGLTLGSGDKTGCVQLKCIAGWARISAALSCLTESACPDWLIQEPINAYVLNGDALSKSECLFLSHYFNGEDIANSLCQARVNSFADLVYYSYMVLCDLHAAVLSDKLFSDRCLLDYMGEHLENNLDYSLLSNLLGNRLENNPKTNFEINKVARCKLLRTVLLLFPIDRRCCKIEELVLTPSLFTELMKSSYAVPMFTALYEIIPYQFQLTVPTSLLLDFVDTVENYFIARTTNAINQHSHAQRINDEPLSLIAHFLIKKELSINFLRRLVSSEKIRFMQKNGLYWSFDSLSAFACFYNLHYLLEIDSYDDESVMKNDREILESKMYVIPPSGSRILMLIRIGLMNSLFAYRNEAIIKGFMSLLNKRDVFRFVLDESLCKTSPISSSDLQTMIIESQSTFELVLGVIAELTYRFIIAGISGSQLFPDTANVVNYGFYQPSATHNIVQTSTETLNNYFVSVSIIFGYFLYEKSSSIHMILPSEANSGRYIKVRLQNLVLTRKKVYDYVAGLNHTDFDATNLQFYLVLLSRASEMFGKPLQENKVQVAELVCGKQFNTGVDCRKETLLVTPQESHAVNVTPSDSNDIQDLTPPALVTDVPPSDDTPAFAQPSGRTIFNSSSQITGVKLEVAYHTPNPDAQVRITHWFELRRTQARNLLAYLFQNLKTANPQVRLCADFRSKGPEEAKAMAGQLTDLAAESSNLECSLKDIPYQFAILDPSVLPFAQTALNAIRDELEISFRWHLDEGLRILSESGDFNNTVIVSGRPLVIAVLWQTLAHISPFFDVMHPVACQWDNLRTSFAAWLWGEFRKDLSNYWTSVCSKSINRPKIIPNLKFCLRRLPAELDAGSISPLGDLTPDRIEALLKNSRLLDRISSAFYRFQCSGMANAHAAIGGNKSAPLTVADLNDVFSSTEASVRDMFVSLWSTLNTNLAAEDALHDNEIAAAGFLKRYAPYVLSGLETHDLVDEAQNRLEEDIEERQKRRRKEVPEESPALRRTSSVKKGETVSPILSAVCTMINDIKKTANTTTKVRSPQANNDPFGTIPISDRNRLEVPIPRSACSSLISQSLLEKHISLSPCSLSSGPFVGTAMPSLPNLLSFTPLSNIWKEMSLHPTNNVWTCGENRNLVENYHNMGSHLSEVSKVDQAVLNSVLSVLYNKGFTGLYSYDLKTIIPIDPEIPHDLKSEYEVPTLSADASPQSPSTGNDSEELEIRPRLRNSNILEIFDGNTTLSYNNPSTISVRRVSDLTSAIL